MVSFKTSGYGGKTLKKVILVKTDDPMKKRFNLVVTGQVEKIVEITPRSVYLDGAPGETMESIVKITPSEKYKFSILGMEQKMNNGIKASLVEPEQGENFWKIKIKTTLDRADTLYDVLTLRTDSRYRPKLTIRVYAVFSKKQDKAS